MLPIVLCSDHVAVGLAGQGALCERRRQWLAEAGISPISVDAGDMHALDNIRLLFVAGLPREQAGPLAARARALGVLVNVEDDTALCDFHVPAIVRRGDLLLSISTGGRSPGLARLLREWLANRFGPEWGDYLDHAGRSRAAWLAEGLPGSEVSRRTRALAEDRRWFA